MHILDLFFPKRCVGCKKLGRYFCEVCKRTIETSYPICPICERQAIDGWTHPKCQTRYTLDGFSSFFRYSGVIKEGIKSMKYRFVSDLAKEFINLIPDSSLQFITYNPQLTTLIPIPLHPTRERFRGFNQAEKLGKILAKRLNIPLRTDVLRRVKKTTPQVEVKEREKRLVNMEGVFQVDNLKAGLLSGTVFLFDDVFTTGATMRSAANVLKKAGAKKAWGIALAHG